ncbi:MAG TPA: hypothetical protein VGQ26_16520 [Streptosporangiaceae bacterium]|nr:hypothetical protein [Streptosporangiaceae bacterium]
MCTGSIYLAAAGILDGHEASTDWAHAEQLERGVPAAPSSGWWNAER